MKIKMKVGLSGPTISLAPGDTPDYEDDLEAQRLIDAGFAELFVDDAAPAAPPPPPASTAPHAKTPKAASRKPSRGADA